MSAVFIGTILGVIFGIIDVAPMIFMKTGLRADLSAFVHWIVIGFLVGSVDLPLPFFAKGLLISTITAIPILLIVSSGHFPIIISTVVFGLLIGFLTGKFS